MKLFKKFTKENYELVKLNTIYLYNKIVRGWADEDLINFDSHLAKVILPRLQRFIELQDGCPADLTEQEWKDILTHMVFAFEWLSSGRRFDFGSLSFKEREDKARKGLELFGKYFTHLWI